MGHLEQHVNSMSIVLTPEQAESLETVVETIGKTSIPPFYPLAKSALEKFNISVDAHDLYNLYKNFSLFKFSRTEFPTFCALFLEVYKRVGKLFIEPILLARVINIHIVGSGDFFGKLDLVRFCVAITQTVVCMTKSSGYGGVLPPDVNDFLEISNKSIQEDYAKALLSSIPGESPLFDFVNSFVVNVCDSIPVFSIMNMRSASSILDAQFTVRKKRIALDSIPSLETFISLNGGRTQIDGSPVHITAATLSAAIYAECLRSYPRNPMQMYKHVRECLHDTGKEVEIGLPAPEAAIATSIVNDVGCFVYGRQTNNRRMMYYTAVLSTLPLMLIDMVAESFMLVGYRTRIYPGHICYYLCKGLAVNEDEILKYRDKYPEFHAAMVPDIDSPLYLGETSSTSLPNERIVRATVNRMKIALRDETLDIRVVSTSAGYAICFPNRKIANTFICDAPMLDMLCQDVDGQCTTPNAYREMTGDCVSTHAFLPVALLIVNRLMSTHEDTLSGKVIAINTLIKAMFSLRTEQLSTNRECRFFPTNTSFEKYGPIILAGIAHGLCLFGNTEQEIYKAWHTNYRDIETMMGNILLYGAITFLSSEIPRKVAEAFRECVTVFGEKANTEEVKDVLSHFLYGDVRYDFVMINGQESKYTAFNQDAWEGPHIAFVLWAGFQVEILYKRSEKTAEQTSAINNLRDMLRTMCINVKRVIPSERSSHTGHFFPTVYRNNAAYNRYAHTRKTTSTIRHCLATSMGYYGGKAPVVLIDESTAVGDKNMVAKVIAKYAPHSMRALAAIVESRMRSPTHPLPFEDVCFPELTDEFLVRMSTKAIRFPYAVVLGEIRRQTVSIDPVFSILFGEDRFDNKWDLWSQKSGVARAVMDVLHNPITQVRHRLTFPQQDLVIDQFAINCLRIMSKYGSHMTDIRFERYKRKPSCYGTDASSVTHTFEDLGDGSNMEVLRNLRHGGASIGRTYDREPEPKRPRTDSQPIPSKT